MCFWVQNQAVGSEDVVIGVVFRYVWISLSARLSIDDNPSRAVLFKASSSAKSSSSGDFFKCLEEGGFSSSSSPSVSTPSWFPSWTATGSSEFESIFPLILSQTAVLLSIKLLKRGSKAVASSKNNLMSSFLYRVDRFSQTLFFKSAANAVSPFSAAKCF